jgi:hypothetical protein
MISERVYIHNQTINLLLESVKHSQMTVQK